MNSSELTMLISSIAVVISNEITDDDELALLGSSITRLGNTLTAMCAQRALINRIEARKEKASPADHPATDSPILNQASTDEKKKDGMAEAERNSAR